jgi:phospholipid/cholesterol/gamma-HCH transport system ATP-binding protein
MPLADDVPKIELRGVSRRFGANVILRELSLAVFPGETLVVIGESGCGKSLTLKLMMALMAPSGGHVLWDGADVATLSERERCHRRLRFGYLFQGAALFDSLNVFENVAFGLRQNTDLDEERIREIVADRLHEEARTAFGRPKEAGRARTGAGANARCHVLRRTHHGPRSHHDGCHQ